MVDFKLMLTTEIYFGKTSINHLPTLIKNLGVERIMIVQGKGSAKANGVYDKVCEQLKSISKNCIEFNGVEQNTLINTVRRAVEIGKKSKTEAIIAIGGGSVIDCAKWIAVGCKNHAEIRELVQNSQKIKENLPVIAIPTMAASGSETDSFAVIYDTEENRKIGVDAIHFRPRATIMNPEFTYSVPKYETGCGIADIISHIIENICAKETGEIHINFAIAILKTCLECGRRLCENLEDYEARANIMLAGNWAINGLLSGGKRGDWLLHPIEHYLGCYYNITHGEGMGILLVHWLEFLKIRGENKMLRMLEKEILFGERHGNSEQNIIEYFKEFFEDFGMPICLKQLDITDEKFEIISNRVFSELKDTYILMQKEDILQLLYISLERG